MPPKWNLRFISDPNSRIGRRFLSWNSRVFASPFQNTHLLSFFISLMCKNVYLIFFDSNNLHTLTGQKTLQSIKDTWFLQRTLPSRNWGKYGGRCVGLSIIFSFSPFHLSLVRLKCALKTFPKDKNWNFSSLPDRGFWGTFQRKVFTFRLRFIEIRQQHGTTAQSEVSDFCILHSIGRGFTITRKFFRKCL